MTTDHQGLVASVLVSRCPFIGSVALPWIVSLTCLWDPLELVLASNTNTPSILRYPTDAFGPVNALPLTVLISAHAKKAPGPTCKKSSSASAGSNPRVGMLFVSGTK